MYTTYPSIALPWLDVAFACFIDQSMDVISPSLCKPLLTLSPGLMFNYYSLYSLFKVAYHTTSLSPPSLQCLHYPILIFIAPGSSLVKLVST